MAKEILSIFETIMLSDIPPKLATLRDWHHGFFASRRENQVESQGLAGERKKLFPVEG